MMQVYNGKNNHYRSMLEHALGDHILKLIYDESVMQVMVNPDGKVWVDAIGRPKYRTDEIISPTQREQVIRIIATHVNMEATQETPSVYAELQEFNARFQGQMPPIVTAPGFVISKHQSVLFSLSDYVERGYLSPHWEQAIKQALDDMKSILVVGGVKSGKTTLANALLLHLSETTNDRILIVEDTKELQCKSENLFDMRSQWKGMDMHDLIRDSLRLSPDRIVVGEVRGKEASALIEAWSVGHPGIATLHGNSCEEALTRLETMLIRAGIQSNFERIIASAIDVMIFIKRLQNKSAWQIEEVVQLKIDNGKYFLETL